MDFWQQEKWNGNIPLKLHVVKDVPNTNFTRITPEINENKPETKWCIIKFFIYIYLVIVVINCIN